MQATDIQTAGTAALGTEAASANGMRDKGRGRPRDEPQESSYRERLR